MFRLFVGILACSTIAAASFAAADVIVPNTSEWKWLHPTDGVDPAELVKDFHTTFFKLEFDDSTWNTGKDSPGPHGGFGYGEDGFEGVDLDRPDAEDDRKSAYFRLKFKTDKEHKGLVFKCQRDDGIIVYLDGKEVARDNVGTGTEAYGLYAVKSTSSKDEVKVQSYKLSEPLPAGEHILAISLHNRPPVSSDMRIAEISLETADKEAEKPKDKKPADKEPADQKASGGR